MDNVIIYFVIHRSTQIVFQDDDYALCTVSLFHKVVDEFKHKAREHKFIVRDFVYNPEELAAGKNELTKLATDKKKQFGPLVSNSHWNITHDKQRLIRRSWLDDMSKI